MESNLSSVPPVWPRPRPEIIGTKPPQAAIIGPSISETTSPTPPVECLSTTGPGRFSERHSITWPESRMASVKATRSSMFMSLKKTAIASAAIWPSVTLLSVMPRTKNWISCAVSAPPSRFLRMISWVKNMCCLFF